MSFQIIPSICYDGDGSEQGGLFCCGINRHRWIHSLLVDLVSKARLAGVARFETLCRACVQFPLFPFFFFFLSRSFRTQGGRI